MKDLFWRILNALLDLLFLAVSNYSKGQNNHYAKVPEGLQTKAWNNLRKQVYIVKITFPCLNVIKVIHISIT